MAEHASLYIDGIEFDSFRNCIGPMASLFTEKDRVELRDDLWRAQWSPEADLDSLQCAQYVATAGALCDRLDLLGHTMKDARHHWDDQVNAITTEEDGELLRRPPLDPDSTLSPEEAWDTFFKDYTFDKWCMFIRQGMTAIIEPDFLTNSEAPRKCACPLDVVTSSKSFAGPYNHLPFYWGFPAADLDIDMGTFDFFVILRAVLNDFDSTAEVRVEFSILIDWVDEEYYAVQPLQAVVFTEGNTDRVIIQRCLTLLYPHLQEYLVFCDFDDSELNKGVPQLITTVRTLVLTGVAKPTVAIFDNDAAGREAIQTLGRLQFPFGLKTMSLPYNDLASAYPAIGPQGTMTTDINGSGCSIELYFGQRILSPDGGLSPVRFTTYLPTVKLWQSQVENKSAIQKRFYQMLDDIRDGRRNIDDCDFSGINAILEALFAEISGAFRELAKDEGH